MPLTSEEKKVLSYAKSNLHYSQYENNIFLRPLTVEDVVAEICPLIDRLVKENEELQKENDRLTTELGEAAKYVDIEIVAAEGLDQAVKICNEEREIYWKNLSTLQSRLDVIGKAWKNYKEDCGYPNFKALDRLIGGENVDKRA